MEAALLALKESHTNENTTWIECGPQGHILMMIANTLRTPPEKLIPSSSKTDSGWITISASVKQVYNNGFDIDWEKFQEGYTNAMERLDISSEVEAQKVVGYKEREVG
jgi:acyl transferase domain-containing protein